MIQNVGFNNITPQGNVSIFKKENISNKSFAPSSNYSLPNAHITSLNSINKINTTLNQADMQKYLALVNLAQSMPISANSQNTPVVKQLDILLKNGKLLAKSSHDNSTTLDNLYEMATTKRTKGLNGLTLMSNTLDLLTNPRCITQTFGDIPKNLQVGILQSLDSNDMVKQDPMSMNVETSGTCAAASIEVTMADKYPAEFARWVSKLSSQDEKLTLNVDLSSLSKNKLEAVEIINLLEARKSGFDFNKAKIIVDTDKNAYIRANIQSTHWNKGERNVADVLVQSAIMKLGSQNTYNSLCDIRAGKFNSNPQGLIELEKTFVESLVKNKEITSLVYQQIDEEQNLVGYNCSFDKIKKHIIDTINSGDNVILGYVLTNETSGISKMKGFNPTTNGGLNKVINGHEITVVDYFVDEKGKTNFICIDTDDDCDDFVQYSEDWLLPKIHHAGYPAHIVEKDEQEIMQKAMMA